MIQGLKKTRHPSNIDQLYYWFQNEVFFCKRVQCILSKTNIAKCQVPVHIGPEMRASWALLIQAICSHQITNSTSITRRRLNDFS